MSIPRHTIKAIIFNLLLPGTGYFYIRAMTRYPLGVFLIIGAMHGILRTVDKFVHGNLHHLYQINLSPFFPEFDFSLLGFILTTAVGVDTYFLAQKSQKPQNSPAQ